MKIKLVYNPAALGHDVYVYEIQPDGTVSYATLNWYHNLPEGSQMLVAGHMRDMDIEIERRMARSIFKFANEESK